MVAGRGDRSPTCPDPEPVCPTRLALCHDLPLAIAGIRGCRRSMTPPPNLRWHAGGSGVSGLAPSS